MAYDYHGNYIMKPCRVSTGGGTCMCLPRAPAEYSGRYRNLLYDKVSALYYSLMYDIAPRTHLGWAGDYQGCVSVV